jgi:hypothetical protein
VSLRVPADFWAPFVAEHWGKRPAVFRRPFSGALADGSEVFAALLELASRLRDCDERIAFRFNRGGTPVDDAAAFLPGRRDQDLKSYLGRLSTGGEFGIIVNSFQALHEGVWRRSLGFLAGLYQQVGMPCGGALIDLFTGNYSESFLGFHKDDQDVFTFVVEGKKRLLAWPFETFKDIAGLKGSDQGTSFQLRAFDYRHRTATRPSSSRVSQATSSTGRRATGMSARVTVRPHR